jgi:tetratricopeptide (TPR) repeat protein
MRWLCKGRYDEALAEYQREIAFCEQTTHALKERVLIEVNQKLTSVYMYQGRRRAGARGLCRNDANFLDRLQRGADDPFTRYYVACAYAVLGDKEQALLHLQKAIEGRRNFNVARARVEKDFAGLLDEPEFQALLG